MSGHIAVALVRYCHTSCVGFSIADMERNEYAYTCQEKVSRGIAFSSFLLWDPRACFSSAVVEFGR